MAYVAQQNQDEDQAANVATNIFQSAMSMGGGGQAQQGAQTPQGAAPQGDQSQAVGTGGGEVSKNAAARPMTASSSKEVIRRNTGRQGSPVDLGKIRGDIGAAKPAFQEEANNYVANQRGRTDAVSDDVIKTALSKGGKDYQSVGQRLTKANPGTEEFKPETNVDFSSQLGDIEDSSLRRTFKRMGGPEATAGDGAFDTLLLSKTPGFNQQRSDVRRSATELDADAKKIRETATKDAVEGQKKAYEDETARVRKLIEDSIGGIKGEASKKEAAEEARRKAELKKALEFGGEASYFGRDKTYQDTLNELVRQIAGGDAGLEKDLAYNVRGGGVPVFGSMGPADVNWTDYINADQAAMYGRGQGLLGGGGAVVAPTKQGSFIDIDRGAMEAFVAQKAADLRAERAAEAQRREEEAARLAAEEAARRKEAEDRALAENDKKMGKARDKMTSAFK